MTVLTFDPDGRGRCLHTDLIPLQSIGTLAVERASTIEFDSAAQQWEVRDVNGTLLFRDASRARCLAWEVEFFTQ